MKHIMLTGLALLSLTALTIDSCIFPQNDCFKEYAFEINYNCSPQQDTFRIGDTLWIESLIESKLINQLDNSLVDMSDIEYKIYGDIHRYNEEVTSPPEYDFNYVNKNGAVSISNIGPYAALELSYESEVHNDRRLRVGFVPQVAGLYRVIFYYLTEDYTSIQGIIEKGCSENITFIYTMNNNESDNNYHLLEGYPEIATSEGFREGGGYAFWVIE